MSSNPLDEAMGSTDQELDLARPRPRETVINLPFEILIMIFFNLPAKILLRIAGTCHAFVEAAAYVLRTRMPHAFNVPELHMLFEFGAPDTYPESLKCEYLGIKGINISLPGLRVLADAFAVFHPTPYSPAEMPEGGSADEALELEVAFENSEKFVQFTSNLSVVLSLAKAFIADGTKIGGKMVIRLQRDWLERESSKLISLDHKGTIRVRIEARKTGATDAFEIHVSELHVCATHLLMAIEKAKDTSNKDTEHIRLPVPVAVLRGDD